MAGVLMASQAGCVRLASQGLAEIRGASAQLLPVSGYSADMLQGFGQVQFDPVSTSLPSRLVPGEVVSAFDRTYGRAAGSEKLQAALTAGGPTLRVSTEIQYLQKLGLFKNGLCISRVRMYDGGRQVLDLLVKASNESIRAGDTEKLAEKSAEKVAELLIERPAEVDEGFISFD